MSTPTTAAPAAARGNSVPSPVRQSPLLVMAERCHIELGKLVEVLRKTVIKDTDKHQVSNEELKVVTHD